MTLGYVDNLRGQTMTLGEFTVKKRDLMILHKSVTDCSTIEVGNMLDK